MANEKRLIDADALKKAILAEPWKDQPNMVRLTVDYINIIVDEQTTVDAVEVVRCKDCKHSYEGAAERLMCGRCGQNRNGIRLGGSAVKADDFCSYGERRTEDDHHRTE